MPYVYDETIPLVAQKLNYTQPIIKSNFQAIKELIEKNHIDFNSVAGVGKHSKIDLPVQAPVPAFANDDNGLYTFLNATTSKNELYVHKQIAGVATGTGIPFTASILSNTATAACTNGWSYLPSGLLIRWGTKVGDGALATLSINTATISGGPVLTKALISYVSAYGASGSTAFYCMQTGLTATGTLNLKASAVIAANQYVRYLVIGV